MARRMTLNLVKKIVETVKMSRLLPTAIKSHPAKVQALCFHLNHVIHRFPQIAVDLLKTPKFSSVQLKKVANKSKTQKIGEKKFYQEIEKMWRRV